MLNYIKVKQNSMSKKVIFLILILPFNFLNSQVNHIVVTPNFVQKVEADSFVGVDVLGNSYTIKNNILYKIQGTKLWQYKNPFLGTLARVDIENPLNIILFYQNLNTVIILDNQLNETQKINFSENEIPILASSVGIASQNQLWVFNTLTQQIGLFDYLKNNFKTVSNSFQGTMKHYQSHYNNFEWIDDKLNWFSCDLFGKITSLGSVPDFDKMQIISKSTLFYTKNNKLFYFSSNDTKSYPIELSQKSIVNFFIKDQNLTIFTSEEITNYKITLP